MTGISMVVCMTGREKIMGHAWKVLDDRSWRRLFLFVVGCSRSFASARHRLAALATERVA